MRRYSANYIFTNIGEPIRNGIVGVGDGGRIVEIIDPLGDAVELESTEFYNGVIVPGFINTHCHTELSHFKGKTIPGTGLSGFVQQIRNLRIANSDDPEKHIEVAIDEMLRNGTVAVADICNTSDSFFPKLNTTIRFVNLIEVLGLDSENAEIVFDRARFLKNFADFKSGDHTELTPHSTYTLSEQLWNMLGKELLNNSLASVHFAESKQEADFTMRKEGDLEQTFRSWGLPVEKAPTGTPVAILKKFIPNSIRLLLVHNTFLTRSEAENLKEHFPNLFFVLCPISNLYIENALPEISMLKELGLAITLGTDSLTSSNTLSILDQIITIQNNYPDIPFADTLKWATVNGARALGFEKELGTIEIGKSPGLNLISPFDFTEMKPRKDSRLKKLI